MIGYYILGLAIFLPVAMTLHYLAGEPFATFASAAFAVVMALVGRGFCYLQKRAAKR